VILEALRRRRLRACLAIVAMCCTLSLSQAQESSSSSTGISKVAQKQQRLYQATGVTQMRERFGMDAPAGRGVTIAQVEGNAGRYLPVSTNSRWTGRTIMLAMGGPSEQFGHAEGVGQLIYGDRGIAPAIEAVHAYPVKAWMEKVLKLGTSQSPETTKARVYNHSWIAQDQGNGSAEHILRRLDWHIDKTNAIHVVGVNNGKSSKVPALLGSSHNAIAVGQAQGDSSVGFTRIEVDGRSKPDIVANGGLTSYATGVVTGIVACLLEAADEINAKTRSNVADRAEVVKAVLLTGAIKDEAWKTKPGKPLDEALGAGRANVDRSVLIMKAGQADPGKLSRRAGWDYQAVAPGKSTRYAFKTTQPMGPLTVTLTWHRRIDGRTAIHPQTQQSVWLHTPRLADYDLRLIRIDGDEETTVAESVSNIDNVEHLHVKEMPAGQYAIEVIRQRDLLDPHWPAAMAYLLEVPTASSSASAQTPN